MQLFDRRRVALLGLVLVVATSPVLARAQQSSQSEPTYENAGLGAAAALSSLVYGPVKVAWAITGLIVGGLAYPLSGGDADIMMKVINTSVRGDYVITPAHLRGEQPLEFFGRAPEDSYGRSPDDGYGGSSTEAGPSDYGS